MSGVSEPGNHHLALASIDLINVVYEKAAKAVFLYFHLNFWKPQGLYLTFGTSPEVTTKLIMGLEHLDDGD